MTWLEEKQARLLEDHIHELAALFQPDQLGKIERTERDLPYVEMGWMEFLN